MVYDLAVADWVLVIGKEKTKIGVSNFFVQKFKSISPVFRQLMRGRQFQDGLPHDIPLPDLQRFTTKMEYYIQEATYDDAPYVYYEVHAPPSGRDNKFMGGIEPQSGCAVALERSVINIEMFAFGCMYDIRELRLLALKKLRRGLRPAWHDPSFTGLIAAADSPPSNEAAVMLRNEVRAALRDNSLSRKQWEAIKTDLMLAIEQWKKTKQPGWRDEWECVMGFISGVEGKKQLLAGDPFY